MKLVFAGTPDFAATALSALLAAGHDVALVLTQPDRPSGRGLQLQASPVKALALAHGLAVLQPHGLRIGGRFGADARTAHDALRAAPFDAMVVAAYGLILPPSVLEIPRLGCINLHASLLPRWRGAAPIQRAIEAGDARTGITVMQMDAGLDTGSMLSVVPIAIDANDTATTLGVKLAELGARAIVAALPALDAGELVAVPQHPEGDASQVTYAAKLSKAEAPIDFDRPSRQVVDRVRAFDPWPGSSATLHDRAGATVASYKICRAENVPPRFLAAAEIGASPGLVLRGVDDSRTPDAIVVATADGAVALTELQKPGGKRLAARHFAPDFADRDGLRFTR